MWLDQPLDEGSAYFQSRGFDCRLDEYSFRDVWGIVEYYDEAEDIFFIEFWSLWPCQEIKYSSTAQFTFKYNEGAPVLADMYYWGDVEDAAAGDIESFAIDPYAAQSVAMIQNYAGWSPTVRIQPLAAGRP